MGAVAHVEFKSRSFERKIRAPSDKRQRVPISSWYIDKGLGDKVNIHKTILTTLAALGMSQPGCQNSYKDDIGGGCTDSESFNVSMTLSEADTQGFLGEDWMGGDASYCEILQK